jgi:glycosyltransferase involved in cell wall biosynthesis
MPDLGPGTEIIFVDGASTDGTKERIEEVIDRYRGSKDIKLILQMPEASYGDRKDDPDAPTVMLKLGKGDAVRKGFDAASGDVLMILDADLTVPPEDLPRFLRPIATGKGRFINGTRLVYPMEERAMKFVNYVGNWFFSKLFTWLLEQPIRDTLCGTKVLLKSDYAEIKAGRKHFGDFDPFGDFDLLFGAARLGIPIVEVPVRYRRRLAGVSKVRVSRHGWLLVAMSLVAFRRLKLARWKAKLRGTRRP